MEELKIRYNSWKIPDWVCKPKKVRILVSSFDALKYSIGFLKKIKHKRFQGWMKNIF